ncbi:MAG: hypothetical protein WC847_01480 [Candidatus Paceibacterota bacterium]|jgi:hypothetical protein
MRFKFLLLYLAIIVTIFGTTLPTQVEAVSPSSILVNISPENPAPKENVTITLSSYAANLDSVLILWSVDGQNTLSGVGKKSLSLDAPGSGLETRVVVKISLPDGIIEKNILIRPSSMVLLWQAEDSYVPPFYKGKAMPSAESSVKIVAMPEAKSGSLLVNPKHMTYYWKQDYTNNVEGSGYGKNSFTFVNDYLDSSNNISVVASTTDEKYSSQANIDIATYQPKILFYKNNYNMGTLWENALYNGYKIYGDGIIEASPYFISPGDIRVPLLNWTWSINDFQIDITGPKKNVFPVQVQPGVSGRSTIKLSIENIYKITGAISKELGVEF